MMMRKSQQLWPRNSDQIYASVWALLGHHFSPLHKRYFSREFEINDGKDNWGNWVTIINGQH